jgi:hypothetical protein
MDLNPHEQQPNDCPPRHAARGPWRRCLADGHPAGGHRGPGSRDACSGPRPRRLVDGRPAAAHTEIRPPRHAARGPGQRCPADDTQWADTTGSKGCVSRPRNHGLQAQRAGHSPSPAQRAGYGPLPQTVYRPNGPTIPRVPYTMRRTVGPLGLTEWSGDRPGPGPSTLAGGTAGPLGRMKARAGPTITNRTQTELCAPTGPERHTSTCIAAPGNLGRQAQRAGHSPSPAHRTGTGPGNAPTPQPVCRPNGPTIPRVARGLANGRPVGPDGMVGGSSTSRAFDPGWGNTWPLGPADGPFGPDHPEPHTNRLVRPNEVAGGARHSWTEPGLPPWKSP